MARKNEYKKIHAKQKGGKIQVHDLRFLSKETRLTNYSTIPNELYGSGISSTAMIVYAKLLNRANLSISNGRVDELGRIYVFYRIEDLADEIGRSTSTIKENINELVEADLIEKRRADKGRANLIFVKVPESSLTDGKQAIYGTDNKPFNGGKTNHVTGGKVASNNYKNKTNIITNYNFEEGESL